MNQQYCLEKGLMDCLEKGLRLAKTMLIQQRQLQYQGQGQTATCTHTIQDCQQRPDQSIKTLAPIETHRPSMQQLPWQTWQPAFSVSILSNISIGCADRCAVFGGISTHMILLTELFAGKLVQLDHFATQSPAIHNVRACVMQSVQSAQSDASSSQHRHAICKCLSCTP